jgi:hypothetical protein
MLKLNSNTIRLFQKTGRKSMNRNENKRCEMTVISSRNREHMSALKFNIYLLNHLETKHSDQKARKGSCGFSQMEGSPCKVAHWYMYNTGAASSFHGTNLQPRVSCVHF